MKELEIKASSLHFRLATVYSDFDSFHGTQDICIYIRKCVRGVFNILIALFLCAFVVGGSTIHLLLGIYFASFHGLQFEMTIYMMPIMCILVLALILGAAYIVIGAIVFILKTIKDKATTSIRYAAASETPPFYINAYRSVKQKTCVKVKVKYGQ